MKILFNNYPSESIEIHSIIFDLDGVISNTAKLHSYCWISEFNLFLERLGVNDCQLDHWHYENFLDGKTRVEGCKSLILYLQESLKLNLSYGLDSYIDQICENKNKNFNKLISNNLEVFQDALDFIQDIEGKDLGLFTYSSSKNAELILKKIGIYDKFKYNLTGLEVEKNGLRSKPYQDGYKYLIDYFCLDKENTVVFEDAISGVQSASAAEIKYIIGINRKGSRDFTKELKSSGASHVINSFSELYIIN